MNKNSFYRDLGSHFIKADATFAVIKNEKRKRKTIKNILQ